MSLAPGTKLGPYELIALLGAGGMGEVYRARDSRLGRDVAIKVSADRFTDRFEREAHAIATLNHPNICTLHDVGPNYLVMELIEGPTLAERIKRGAIPLAEALLIAKQIADALDAAHSKGIVHRDLKPANIKLGDGDKVKVLDFGLAKTMKETAPQEDDALQSLEGRLKRLVASDTEDPSTETAQLTRAGAILGTAAYMAPEQARGKPVDHRVDIWAFGVVLYEMLTGKPAFTGESLTEVLAGVMKEDPDLTKAPATAHRLLESCLQKNPAERLRAIADWRLLLEDVPSAVARGNRSAFAIAGWVLALLAVLATTFTVVWVRGKSEPARPPIRFDIPAPERATPLMKLSPDGRKLAFLAGGRLWVHYLDSGESRDLTGNQGVPFWSPDSQFIGYSLPHKVLKIAATGGPPILVSERGALWGGGTWNRDDVIVFAGRLAGIFRVPASGGVPLQIVAPDAAHQQFGPAFLPDGRHFLYTRTASDLTNGSIYVGSVDAKPEQQSSKPLVASNWQPEYAPPADLNLGHLLFVRDGTLMAQPFDNRRLELQGKAAPVAEHVQVIDDLTGFGAYGAFSASANDVLVFRRSTGPSQRLYRLTLFDRKGSAVGTVGEASLFNGYGAVSPDGKRAAVAINDLAETPPTSDIWIFDLSKGTRARLTFGPGGSIQPVWSADGTRVAFMRNGRLYWKAADGSGEEKALPLTGTNSSPTSFSQDGRYLLYDVGEGQSGSDIWVQPLHGDLNPFLFLGTPANEKSAAFSPDGRWVAYRSAENLPEEIYVRPFPPSSGGKWLVSKGGTISGPRWRADGKELGYTAPDGSIMAVPIMANSVFQSGEPEVLFKIPKGALALGSTPDRARFLMAMPLDASGSAPEPLAVVLNWTSLLKK